MIRTTEKFNKREERCFKLDDLFYYKLQKTFIEEFYKNEHLDDFSVNEITDILFMMSEVDIHIATRELAVRIRFIDAIKELTPKIYEWFYNENEYCKYSFKECRMKNELLLNWRLHNDDMLDLKRKLTDKEIYEIATKGFNEERL